MPKQKPTSLGDLVVAAYDAADRVSGNEKTKTWLAAAAVRKLLLRAGRVDLAQLLTGSAN